MQINFGKWNSPNRIKYYLNKLNSYRSVYQFVQCLSISYLQSKKNLRNLRIQISIKGTKSNKISPSICVSAARGRSFF